MYKPLADLLRELRPYMDQPTHYVYSTSPNSITIYKVTEIDEIKL